MRSRPFTYLFSIAYFGARFKGWSKQKNQPTVEGKLERVFRYVLGHEDFRLIGSSRTDSGVSCRQGFVQLFLREEFDFEPILPALNLNLNGEIRIYLVRKIPRDFNLIHSVKQKTYRYFFSDSDSFHPFASAFLTNVSNSNTLERMMENSSLFVGRHDFRAFSKILGNKRDYVREVLEAKVFKTETFFLEFSPEKVYCFEVSGTGFLYHQVRKMVHAIWYSSSEEIKLRLENPHAQWETIPTAAPNGLVLWQSVLDLDD